MGSDIDGIGDLFAFIGRMAMRLLTGLFEVLLYGFPGGKWGLRIVSALLGVSALIAIWFANLFTPKFEAGPLFWGLALAALSVIAWIWSNRIKSDF
ncbi:MAG: hypothetical protein AAGC95_06520 [Pseudomonadota bacterium]